MENTSHERKTEPDSNDADIELPQFQSLYTAVPTTEAVDNPQVSIRSISPSLSSFPRRQAHSDTEESLRSYYPWQPHFGIPFHSPADVAENNSNVFMIPATTVPSRTSDGHVKSYSEDVWEAHKSQIRQLYIGDDKKLVDVMQQMSIEQDFKPSIKMYKTHLAAWGLFKKNREKDVTSLLTVKKARDAAGKSSVIFRSGKPVDMQKIYRYLRRKKVDTHTPALVEENSQTVRVANHICIRTPSPISKPINLSFPSHNLRDKEIVLHNINQLYGVWISESPSSCVSKDNHEPRMFLSGWMGGLNVFDSMYLLLQHGMNLFQVNRFSEGGIYIRGAFILVETLFDTSITCGLNRQHIPWIFEFWNFLSECFYPDISRMLLIHMAKMAGKCLPRLHPLQEILCCLCRTHSRNEREIFAQFISSTWADAIHAVKDHLNSSGMVAAFCLPYNFWMGETDGHLRQFQETIMEFRRAETMSSCQQHTKNFAFTLCNQKQLFQQSPSHTGTLTLMWLRHFVLDSVKDTTGLRPSRQHQTYDSNVQNCLVKTAILTRLELSIGEGSDQAGYDVRILSGDLYQVGHLHRLQPGEDIEAFKNRHSLEMSSFEKAKHVFQASSGVEAGFMTRFKWFQTLEESLIGSGDLPAVEERQRVQSLVLHECICRTGICD